LIFIQKKLKLTLYNILENMKYLPKSYKTSIAALSGATIIYLQSKNIIDSNDATFAANILVAL